MAERLTYDTECDLADLNQEIDAIWQDLSESGALRERAIAAGLGGDGLSGNREVYVRVEHRGQGFDPLTTAILVGIATGVAEEAAKAAAHAALGVWSDVIVPRLRARFGAGAVIPCAPASPTSTAGSVEKPAERPAP